MAISIQTLTNSLSFSMSLNQLFPKISISGAKSPPSLVIRMGGGPRTFPGGVSKWQWKRMQAKKAKQLLKARLARERQIYEMRKRAELRAATSELERPWEAVAAVSVAPTLLSVPADEQLKVLADRFQRPGGFDMWTAKDGPQLFPFPDELPSARYFPKGVVHSIKPYRRELPASSGDGDDDPWKSASNSEESATSDFKRNSGKGDHNWETGSTELASSYPKRNYGSPSGRSAEARPRSQISSDFRRSNSFEPRSERSSDFKRLNSFEPRSERSSDLKRSNSSEPRSERSSDFKRSNASEPRNKRLSNFKRSNSSEPRNKRSSDFKRSNSSEPRSERSSDFKRSNSFQPRSDRSSDFKRSNSFDSRSERSSDFRRSNPFEPRSDHREFRTKRSRNSGNRDNRFKRETDSRSEVYDMSLEGDGSYGFR